MKRFVLILLSLTLLLVVACRSVNPLMIRLENDLPSESSGESWNGKLKNGKRLPNKGQNFRTVSYFLTALGRNGVHHAVRDLTLEAYDSLYALNPEWKYLYGETGWVHGGKFFPHYTHQNGLIVDYMVPVMRTRDSSSTRLKTHLFNRWGYAYEFDSLARSGKIAIDFESMAAHLYFIKKLAAKHGLEFKHMIFEPAYAKALYSTTYGPEIRELLIIYKKHWVRHDDHYHVEFRVKPKEKD